MQRCTIANSPKYASLYYLIIHEYTNNWNLLFYSYWVMQRLSFSYQKNFDTKVCSVFTIMHKLQFVYTIVYFTMYIYLVKIYEFFYIYSFSFIFNSAQHNYRHVHIPQYNRGVYILIDLPPPPPGKSRQLHLRDY